MQAWIEIEHVRSSEAPDDEVEPDLFGAQFENLGQLGVGGMGEVFLAEVLRPTRRLRTGQLVALKFIRDDQAADPSILKRFKKEATVGIGLAHPNLVRSYALARLRVGGRNRQALIMEYVKGRTLRQLIDEDGSIAEDACIFIARQIATALIVLHGRGIIHRDLKPTNVFICDDLTVKVGDFGVVRDFNAPSLTQTDQIPGTAEYHAPEQKNGGAVDARTDLYALGILLYELATGRYPPLSERATLAPDGERGLKWLGNNSHSYSRIVERLLMSRPENRFQTTKELSKAFAPYERSLNEQMLVSAVTEALEIPAPVLAEAVLSLVFKNMKSEESILADPTASRIRALFSEGKQLDYPEGKKQRVIRPVLEPKGVKRPAQRRT